ncbi:S66 peptidase family protein [Mesoterricola silvestris]|uniref:S66 peptidase family protein n=1 Tax=Mesoterricola silvestris TaxID=2927979 RepID=UPI0029307498|nr:LD-carboxypeptidase [Mesoterricola silvestris]
MAQNRRSFLRSALLAAAAVPLAPGLMASQAPAGSRGTLKARRLSQGQTVGLISPAGATWQSDEIKIIREALAALGLESKVGRHALDRYGYLAGTDADRAADVNAMFADDSVDAVLCVRGGWGCNRILPLVDFRAIAAHPKILLGYSDITSLLNAVQARTGLVTFHGPVGTSVWNAYSVDWLRRVLFKGEAVIMENPHVIGDSLVQINDRVRTIRPGTARGRLLGGNLTVLAAMAGSPYLPDFNGAILFLEDTNEHIYRIDRMLTQLKLAGILDRIAGFVFGNCTKCDPGDGHGSLSLEQVLDDHILPLKIPAWAGAMIGHIENKFMVPVGIPAEIDAALGTITMLEPAVR